MGNDLVVKSNTIINASHYLSLVEQRLVGLAIIKLRKVETPFSHERMLEVRANDYMEAFGVDRATAYQALKEAVDKLFDRQFQYDVFYVQGTDEVPSKITNIPPKVMGRDDWSQQLKSRWVSKALYEPKQGLALLAFTPDVLEYLTDLKTYFTQYYLSQTVELSSSYAYRLFEIVMQWKSVGKTPIITIEDLRGRLGVEDGKYSAMNDFKKRVLDVAIEQVSKGEYTVTYKQHKAGRTISGFEFIFKKNVKQETVNNNRDPNVIDMFENITDKEREIIRATADKHIKDKGITDLAHRTNIYKKAMAERWGLGEHDKQMADLSAQNIKVMEKIEADRQEQLKKEQEREYQKQEAEKFTAHFESLPQFEQERILELVRQEVQTIPFLVQKFNENSYQDVMFRGYFKKYIDLA